MSSGFVDAAEHLIAGPEIDDAHGASARRGEADGFSVLQEHRARFVAFVRVQDGFDEEHGTHFHLHSANGGQEGFPFAVHDKHGIARLKFAQIARSVMGKPDVGMDGARIDPEGAGVNLSV